MLKNDHLPARTWEWLKVNDIDLPDISALEGADKVNEHVVSTKADNDAPECIEITVSGDTASASLHDFDIKPGVSHAVVQFITSSDRSSGMLVLQNRYHIAPDSNLTLVQVQDLSDDMRFYNERVENSRNFANKVWNASRFIMMNMEGKQVNVPDAADLEPVA